MRSHEQGRVLGVAQKTAWYMLGRLRLAMQVAGNSRLQGKVEVDETYIGGKTRNMHAWLKAETIKGTGLSGKAIAMRLWSATRK